MFVSASRSVTAARVAARSAVARATIAPGGRGTGPCRHVRDDAVRRTLRFVERARVDLRNPRPRVAVCSRWSLLIRDLWCRALVPPMSLS